MWDTVDRKPGKEGFCECCQRDCETIEFEHNQHLCIVCLSEYAQHEISRLEAELDERSI